MADHVSKIISPVRPIPAALDLGVIAVTLLAPALGGSTLLWQQALVFAAGAVLILLSPPRVALPLPLNLVLGALLLVAAVPLLPVSVITPYPWRYQLSGQFQIPFINASSLQPWLTLEGVGQMFGGLVWAVFLFTRRWELSQRALLEWFSAGVLALTSVAIGCYVSGWKPALWKVDTGFFGFFPHRNQTATLLALTGIVVLALGYERFKKKHPLALVWLAAYLILGVALVLNYSRAGVLLFALGSVAWLLCVSLYSRKYHLLGIGLTGMAALVAVFILFGGQTWERFRPHVKTGTQAPSVDFRILIQQDALSLVRPSYWYGAGLGNFEPIFAQNRQRSNNDLHAEHPDSDWVWLLVELGWLGTALVVAALALALRPCWPFELGSARRLRTAVTVGVALFLLHGFVDVSGHRLGTVWPGLFLLALARNRPVANSRESNLVAGINRGLALIVLGVAGAWWASLNTAQAWYTSGRLEQLYHRLGQAVARRDPQSAFESAHEAIRTAPLDWRLYLRRAAARAQIDPFDPEIEKDFERARHLEPNLTGVPFEEAGVWLAAGQRDRAIEAWRETLRRAGTQFDGKYPLMLLEGSRDPELRPGLWRITGLDAGRKLQFLGQTSTEEFDGYLRAWLRDDPRLEGMTAGFQKQILAAWFARGDRPHMEEYLTTHLPRHPVAGLWLAELAAARGNFQLAYETAYRLVPRPQFPPRGERRALLRLEREFAQKSTDFGAGLALYFGYREIEDEQPEAALEIAKKLTALPKCPGYLFYLLSESHARRGEWEQAWAAWKKFAGPPG